MTAPEPFDSMSTREGVPTGDGRLPGGTPGQRARAWFDAPLPVLESDDVLVGQAGAEAGVDLGDREACWRCVARPAAGELGLCDPCREALAAERPPPALVPTATPTVYSMDADGNRFELGTLVEFSYQRPASLDAPIDLSVSPLGYAALMVRFTEGIAEIGRYVAGAFALQGAALVEATASFLALLHANGCLDGQCSSCHGALPKRRSGDYGRCRRCVARP